MRRDLRPDMRLTPAALPRPIWPLLSGTSDLLPGPGALLGGRLLRLHPQPGIVQPHLETLLDLIRERKLEGAVLPCWMTQHEHGGIHQVARPAGEQLEPNQALEVDDAEDGAFAEGQRDAEGPVERHEGGQD